MRWVSFFLKLSCYTKNLQRGIFFISTSYQQTPINIFFKLSWLLLWKKVSLELTVSLKTHVYRSFLWLLNMKIRMIFIPVWFLMCLLRVDRLPKHFWQTSHWWVYFVYQLCEFRHLFLENVFLRVWEEKFLFFLLDSVTQSKNYKQLIGIKLFFLKWTFICC